MPPVAAVSAGSRRILRAIHPVSRAKESLRIAPSENGRAARVSCLSLSFSSLHFLEERREGGGKKGDRGGLRLTVHKRHNLHVGHRHPESISRQHNKLIAWLDRMHFNLGRRYQRDPAGKSREEERHADDNRGKQHTYVRCQFKGAASTQQTQAEDSNRSQHGKVTSGVAVLGWVG
jgi:hypothetical protein